MTAAVIFPGIQQTREILARWPPATYPFNLTGQPALSLPAGLSRAGLPVGVQLAGPAGADELVLAAARRLEAALEPLPAPPRRVPEGVL